MTYSRNAFIRDKRVRERETGERDKREIRER